jgi:hypothetical protein
VSFFHELQKKNNTYISGNEIYLKQSYRNRCEILTANGIQTLSIPVSRPNGTMTKTSDVLISDQKNWRMDHWRTIESAYKNAPYFEFYDIEVKDLLFQKAQNLMYFNQNIMDFFCSIWDLNQVKLSDSSFQNFQHRVFLGRKLQVKSYKQVFNDRFGFQANLSVLDLLFCEGPLGRNWII